jgi:hypothetical protein
MTGGKLYAQYEGRQDFSSEGEYIFHDSSVTWKISTGTTVLGRVADAPRIIVGYGYIPAKLPQLSCAWNVG